MLTPLYSDPYLRDSIDLVRYSGDCRLGKVIYKPGGFWPLTNYDFYELFGITHGSAILNVNNTSVTVSTGNVCLLPPHVDVTRHFSKETETHQFWMAFNCELLTKNTQKLAKDAPLCLPMSPAFKALIEAGFSIPHTHSESACHFLESLAECAVAEYLNMAEYTQFSSLTHGPVHKALNVLHNQYADHDCLPKAIAASHVTANHLTKLFQKELQTSPSKLLWKIRTIRGLELTKETALQVSEIAFLCGFRNPYHFSRLIKQYCGKSPRELRNSQQSPLS
ncbi:AraC family transcriptional regulator [Rubritalea tangerina]|uniref:AraC family transcriptional regulator n=1 Tax=Rubritalea tangerina TaxID=430798 RepID=A0ABW4ZDM6_9BACT